jgi:hypothetical protein
MWPDVRSGPFRKTRENRVNDTNDIWAPAEARVEDGPEPTAPRRTRRRALGTQKAKLAGALMIGGIAGAAILGPLSALAASPTAAPSAGTTGTGGAAGTATGPIASGDPDRGPGGPDRGPGGPGGFGRDEAVSDTSVVAKAIGIGEADLKTALAGGQTVAQVAKAHDVALQIVIDALVADGQSALDAAV